MNINYRQSLIKINKLLSSTPYRLLDCRNTSYSGNYQITENGETCGVYFKKIDAINDIKKFLE